MPVIKLNRLRRNSLLRDLTAEVVLDVSDLVMPYFVCEGRNKRQPVKSMPGIFKFSQDKLLAEIKSIKRLGIKAVMLFGVPAHKDERASGAYAEGGLVQGAVSLLKKSLPGVAVITDVCLCAYTLSGYCGILKITGPKQNVKEGPAVDSEETLKAVSLAALSHARAGADIVAPSGMMDGQVAAIRASLDKSGFADTAIMSYSAKFASNLYGPFREAAGSAVKSGDRKSHQLDFRNRREALREIEQDILEGADIAMIKPALGYLDIISKARDKFNIPLAAYNVSGEYAMVKAYGRGSEEKNIVLEILTAIKRAGADIIVTYHAKEAAGWLK